MPLSMPTYLQLSTEQKAILEDASFDETLMVTGPPGTGKTVIAMWQSKQMSDSRPTPISLIMYNRVLRAYTGGWSAWQDSANVSVNTYHSWAFRMWKQAGGTGYPPQEPKWNYLWEQMNRVLLQATTSGGAAMNFGHVVIDEAQDFSKSFYESLALLSSVDRITVSVVADENQRLEESRNSSLKEIQDGLALGGVIQKYPLTKNYRNTFEIDAFARRFFVGLITGQADPPEGVHGDKPLLCGYRAGTNGMVSAIERHAKNNPSQSILVVCPTKRLCKSMCNKLKLRLDDHQVAAYLRAGDEEDLNIGEPKTVTLVHWMSMEGIEADALFVPNLELFDLGEDSTNGELMRLYVMCSRARLRLELQYESTSSSHRLVELIRDKGAGVLEERDS
jgi:DNA helicase-2/ATP-dependent DNA helicase PcrA